jgi:hypothetical protein
MSSKTLLDLLANVDVMLDVFRRHVFGEGFEHFLNLLLRAFYGAESCRVAR